MASPAPSAKAIRLRPIAPAAADRIVKALHYSGKVVQNSYIHLGVFLGERCGGVLQYGPCMDKRRMMPLVRGTQWDQFLELNRMALAEWLPRNSESRALAISLRLLRARYPRLKWVVTFADGTQCGDGTIYRAAGAVLTQIKKNSTIWRLPGGETVARLSMERASLNPLQRRYNERHGRRIGECATAFMRRIGAQPLPGVQFRYVFFVDPSWRARLAVPEIPFSRIDELGLRMARGQRARPSREAPADQAGEGGATPTRALQEL